MPSRQINDFLQKRTEKIELVPDLLEVRTGGTGGPVPEGVLRFRAGRQTVVKFANHLVQQVEAGPDIVTEKSNKIN